MITVKLAWQADRWAACCSLAMFCGPVVVVVCDEPGTVVPTDEGDDPKLRVSTMTASMPSVATTLKIPSSDDPLSGSSCHSR